MKKKDHSRLTVHSSHTTLSVVLATRNEESNIAECLKSVKEIADEIIIFDEKSSDDTRSIARSFGAEVFVTDHEPIFHLTKQKAIDKATGDWILQMDADERVSPELTKEIREELKIMDNESRRISFENKKRDNPDKWKLFERHERLIREREGRLGKGTGEIVAYFIPRVNYFVGRPLVHAGVYPDGVIRLIKRDKAWLPGKSVHELMEVEGEIAWLFGDIEHHESPTLRRYIARANRYTDLTAKDFAKKKLKKNWFNLLKYSLLLPATDFLLLFIRHKGYKDGIRGFLWSMFSAWHHPLAYWKYWVGSG